MGYSYRNNGQITDFWPDDTATELYIDGDYGYDLEYLLEQIKNHFGDCDMSKYRISAEYIHTSCLTYDRYDSSDYTKFIKITKEEE